MAKVKKRKHYETCMHCAFLHAFKLKYGRVKVREDNPKAFNDMVQSAIKITALVFMKISVDDQRAFIAEVAERSGSLDRLKAMIDSVRQGPTKH